MLTVAVAQGTVYVWFGSASHVTVPELPTLMNLYSTAAPGVRVTVQSQTGLSCVYRDALSGTALFGFQLPRAGTLPVLSCLSQPVCLAQRMACRAEKSR